jgi:hypothetical protein
MRRDGKGDLSDGLKFGGQFDKGRSLEPIDIKGGLQRGVRGLGCAGEESERRKK